MLLFSCVLGDCVVIVKDDNGNNRVIFGSADSMLYYRQRTGCTDPAGWAF